MFAHRFVGFVALAMAALASPAAAQVIWHSDYGGYSIRAGNSVYSYRNDGTSQDFHRFGNVGIYNDSAGTSGDIIYSPSGRYDTYSNSRRRWSGSGFTPYDNPSTSTYRRSYYTAPSEPPKYRFESEGNGSVAYPMLPGTTIRDFDRPGYRIEESGGRRIAYPTLPGTSIRDYSAGSFDLGSAPSPRPTAGSSTRQPYATAAPIAPPRTAQPSPPTTTSEKPQFRFEDEGDETVAIPVVAGTSLTDFGRPGFRIVERNGRLLAYPTSPGTRVRDYSRDPVDLGPAPRD